MERLIVCQGSAQLVTAIAALRQHEAIGESSEPWRDHLLICGLAVTESQTSMFTCVIEKMAALLHPSIKISRLSDVELEGLLGEARHASGAVQLAALLQQIIGIANVDEVFTASDWHPCNVIALCAFPDATHICYGDSVGVYLPRGFMASRPTVSSRVKGLLRQLMPSRTALPTNPRVDISYLLLPDAFGESPSRNVVRTEIAPLRGLFTRLGSLVDGVEMEDLRRRTAGRPLWVLMGSNFSEQGMMTLPEEIAAYCDWIKSLRPDPNTVLMIKSHPRDRTTKCVLLEENIRGIFSDVLSADSVGSAYLPMEALLLDLKPVAATLECLTVSTACLATHFVVGSRTHIGFGEELVKKYFTIGRRHVRCQHESDLRRICGFL